MNRPEVRAAISERTRAALSDPEAQRRRRRAYADPKVRQKISEHTKFAMSDPALRQKISERTKEGMAARLERQFAELVAVWEKTPKKVRQRFLDQCCHSVE